MKISTRIIYGDILPSAADTVIGALGGFTRQK
jgi:hypothetical protein